MNDVLIRMVELRPLRAAYAHALSKTPEQDAWNKQRAWAVPKGLLDNPAEHFNFGYNNPPPDPSAPRRAYGYEVLITVGSEVEPEGEVKTKQIPGGLYAVARCKGTDNIHQTWSYLFHEWLQTNGRYELDEKNEPGLEELLNPSEEKPERWIFDLYLPVRPIARTP
jgi:DNA gyrase inhibitor GyrI